MKITRLNKITNHRAFVNFAWVSDLPDFARFNLIYGWNGAGKTTISNLFRCIEKKEVITEGNVEFYIDGKSCPGVSLNTVQLPNVRVFNKGFVEASVFSSTQEMTPIFFLGQDSADKQKEIERLKAELQKEQQKLANQQSGRGNAAKAFDDMCISEARTIKELLSSSGANPYNNYDKAEFKKAATAIAQQNPLPKPVSDGEKITLKQQKDATSKERLQPIEPSAYDFKILQERVKSLLAETVTSQVLVELQSMPEVAVWVQAGLAHHSGENNTDTCRFCAERIRPERIAQLQAHFNDAYTSFIVEIDKALFGIEELSKMIGNNPLPPKAALFSHLAPEWERENQAFELRASEAKGFLAQVHYALSEKKKRPFEVQTPAWSPESIPEMESVVNLINQLIELHNQAAGNLQQVIAAARKQLESARLCESLQDFISKRDAIVSIEGIITASRSTIRALEDKIAGLEKEVVEHRRPADELNTELKRYLGRDELRFSLHGNGYHITRGGVAASNLSDGERSAIAFLYFLKALKAKDFNLSTDIVVIDDPVSSLDANSIFCAFGCMKECVKDAGQVFIFTHNFAFFRQVKNWFNYLPNQKKKEMALRPGRFFMLESAVETGKRSAVLRRLDPLLHEYESEYHYLFKKVYHEAKSQPGVGNLERFYGMPNLARRALESFLAFRFPAEAGELKDQMDRVSFDPIKKARILRFLHTYSHDGKIAEPEHDLSILSETQQVLAELLELMQAEDQKHFSEMEKLVSLN